MDKHELQAELAKINLEIMQAKNAFQAVKEAEAAYFEAREVEAVNRVKSVLEASQEALDTASANLKTLEAIRHGVSDVVNELNALKCSLEQEKAAFDEYKAKTYASIQEKQVSLEEATLKAKASVTALQSEWDMLAKERKSLDEQARKVRDERLQLKAALNLKK